MITMAWQYGSVLKCLILKITTWILRGLVIYSQTGEKISLKFWNLAVNREKCTSFH